jgi:hypothetical protein
MKRAERAERDALIKEAFDDAKARNGSRRIQVDLAEHGKKPDVKTILNSMGARV